MVRLFRHRKRLAREQMSDAASALAAHSLMRDVVTGGPLELPPGAGVENELSGQLGAVFVFQLALAPAYLLLGIGKGVSDISDLRLRWLAAITGS
jgi:hypothetical protein